MLASQYSSATSHGWVQEDEDDKNYVTPDGRLYDPSVRKLQTTMQKGSEESLGESPMKHPALAGAMSREDDTAHGAARDPKHAAAGAEMV